MYIIEPFFFMIVLYHTCEYNETLTVTIKTLNSAEILDLKKIKQLLRQLFIVE